MKGVVLEHWEKTEVRDGEGHGSKKHNLWKLMEGYLQDK